LIADFDIYGVFVPALVMSGIIAFPLAFVLLANAGHDTRALQAYLGHKNIQHTVRYTELAPTRFKNFWRD
jgi:type 1 fimbriae regulatory protein FimB/type 1 fimbriae regulatory protein FimE